MTNNISDTAQQPAFFAPSPIKLVMLTAVIIFCCIISSSAFIYAFTKTQAKAYTQQQVHLLATQAQATLTPMILVRDILGMNFYLKTLTQASVIQGATLTDGNQQVIARAGSKNSHVQRLNLYSNQLKVGQISLYIDNHSSLAFFSKLLWILGLLSVATALITLIAIAIMAKKVMLEFSLQYKPLLEHRFALELAQVQSLDNANTVTDNSAEAVESGPNQSISLAIVDLEKNTENIVKHSETARDKQQPPKENQALVSLLKPDTQERMPHFKPFSNHPDEEVKQRKQKYNTEIELTESVQSGIDPQPYPISEPANGDKKPENPLFRAHPHEEQLDLYSLEHQTELNLNAADAAYVLFVDCSSNRAPIENPQEHQALLTQYRRLIQMVIGIYGGKVELLANGDIRVMFADTDIQDNHGIQALCAAKLFNQLYKYYNHRQITRMQPTLNLQVSLVRGNKNKIELLREESHFLTRTTDSNELISHTPLSEVAILKETLLDEAQTERREEDKILILSLSPSYQELLEKQARHLAKSL